MYAKSFFHSSIHLFFAFQLMMFMLIRLDRIIGNTKLCRFNLQIKIITVVYTLYSNTAIIRKPVYVNFYLFCSQIVKKGFHPSR